MIHFIVGKPRNGKSLYAAGKIVEQLTKTNRFVVTNMALRLDVLQDYLDSLGHNVHVMERVRIIDDEETKNFWLYREYDYVLPTPTNYNDKNPDNVSYKPLFEDPKFRVGGKLFKEDGSTSDFKGTCYVIDEVQNIWRARGWQGTPIHVDFYLTQHGKLGDVVFFITQNVKNVDRILYSVAQDFTYCRNHRLEKHGRFRGDDKFTAKTYPGPVTDGNQATLNVHEFKLDLALAETYDTSAGVGMPGGGTADAGFRAKGIPLKTVWIGIAACLVAAFLFFGKLLPILTNQYLAPAIDPKHRMAQTCEAKVLPIRGDREPSQGMSSVPGTETQSKVPRLCGVWTEIKDGIRIVHAILEDGRQIPPRSITAFNIEEDGGWVEALGIRYYLRSSKASKAGL